MGIFTYETETASQIAPARLFKALMVDGDNLIPKIVPQAIESTEILEGNGGPGSVMKTTFGDSKYLKQKVDILDADTFTYSYTVFEGDAMPDFAEKIYYERILTPLENGGCVMRVISKYYAKEGHKHDEKLVNEGKAKGSALYQAVEDYLIANPDAYN